MTNELIPAEGYLSGPENPEIGRVVPCRIDGRLYGVPVAQAGDMVVLSSVVPVAYASPTVRGVLNQQGRMATVIEAQVALGAAPPQNPPLIGLTVAHDGHLYVLAVDEVREITVLDPNPAAGHEPIAPLDIAAMVDPC